MSPILELLAQSYGSLQSYLLRPEINYKNIVLGSTVGLAGWNVYLLLRQIPQYSKPAPPALAPHIDGETLKKSQAYGKDKAYFSLFSEVFQLVVDVGLILVDFYPKVWVLSGIALAKVGWSGDIKQSLVLSVLLASQSALTSLPLQLYHTFVLEQKHGFNKSTVALFFIDLVKGLVLSFCIGVPFMSAFMWIIDWAGDRFITWLMAFIIVFQLLMVTLYPIAIQPLFNKLVPLPEGEIRDRVTALATQVGFPLKHIWVIDGSKRSGHSNAYFYGLPWSKHIVIYDTLIEQSTPQEVEAVLAHELGHYALSHPTRLLLISQLQLLVNLNTLHLFLHNTALLKSFNFPSFPSGSQPPIMLAFLMSQMLLSPLESLASFGMKTITRKFEYEADHFACTTVPAYESAPPTPSEEEDPKDSKGTSYHLPLSRALINISKENLSSPNVDWMYSAWHHSHPTLSERLGRMSDEMKDYIPGRIKISKTARVEKKDL